MRRKATKFLLLTTVFFFLSFCMIPSFCNADSLADKGKLKSVVSDIIFAILEKNVDDLMELTQLEGSFQFDKKYYIQYLLNDYSSEYIATSAIEVKSIRIKSDEEAKVMVLTHLSSIDTQGGLGTAPRNEIWNFTKGERGPLRGKWLLVVEKRY